MFLADLYIELTWRRIWKSNLNLPSSDIDESAMKGLYYHCWTPKCRSTTCVCVQKMSATLPLWDIAYYRNKLFHPILLFLLPHPMCVTISVSFLDLYLVNKTWQGKFIFFWVRTWSPQWAERLRISEYFYRTRVRSLFTLVTDSLTSLVPQPTCCWKWVGGTKGLKRAFLSLTAIFSARNGSKL